MLRAFSADPDALYSANPQNVHPRGARSTPVKVSPLSLRDAQAEPWCSGGCVQSHGPEAALEPRFNIAKHGFNIFKDISCSFICFPADCYRKDAFGWELTDLGSRCCSGSNLRPELVLGGEQGSTESMALPHSAFQHHPPSPTTSHRLAGLESPSSHTASSSASPRAPGSVLCAPLCREPCTLLPGCPQAPLAVGMARCIWQRSNHVRTSYKRCTKLGPWICIPQLLRDTLLWALSG